MKRTVPRLLALTVLALLPAACSSGGNTVAPSVSVSGTYTVTGHVRASNDPLPGVLVEVVDGPFAGRSATTEYEGTYRLFALNGSFQLRFSKAGYAAVTRAVSTLNEDRTIDQNLSPSPRAVSGRVTEAPPTDGTPVRGARVFALSASGGDNTETVSDASGHFSVSGIVCPCSLRVEAAGYETRLERFDAAPETAVTIQLLPSARIVTQTFGAPSDPPRPPASFFRDVHQPGRIVVSRLYFYYGFDPSNPPTRTVELWSGSRRIAAASVNQQQWFTDVLDVQVPGGARYEVRITGGPWSAVTITSPI